MIIERLQVQEGFLDGLDIHFDAGLNVIIGGRGTGKTSIVELIRFCLHAQSYTKETKSSSKNHAHSILGPGQVTITLQDGEQRFQVARTVSDNEPRTSFLYSPPITFSQTEIETVGLNAPGRLRLIDSFKQDKEFESEEAIKSKVLSISAELRNLKKEVELQSSQLVRLPELELQLKQLKVEELKQTKKSTALRPQVAQLQDIQRQLDVLTINSGALESIHQQLVAWKDAIEAALKQVPVLSTAVDIAVNNTGVDQRSTKSGILEIEDLLKKSIDLTEKSATEEQTRIAEINLRRIPLEQQARAVRSAISAAGKDTGSLIEQISLTSDEIARLRSLQSLLGERESQIAKLNHRSKSLLDELDAVRKTRFLDRCIVSSTLNQTLMPRVQVKILESAQLKDYQEAISNSLRGSNLRYTELSKQLAFALSPRMLLRHCATGDFETLASEVGIPPDRALRVISQLNEVGPAEILSAVIEDDVYLSLLDGTEYKPVEALSIGQRCTIVLPIVLEQISRVLIVDQPEDHLDNKFITDTLIKSILRRNELAQSIFTSHNANIPVLGNASKVIQMDSDGTRGFVSVSGSLYSPQVVESISNVMEGGAEAFGRRATFYSNLT